MMRFLLLLTLWCSPLALAQVGGPGHFDANRAALLQRMLLNVTQFVNVEAVRQLLTEPKELRMALENVRSQCINDIAFAVLHPSAWVFKMIDATGKLPTGFSDGAIHWVGDYDLCMDNPPPSNYNGSEPGSHYCGVTVVLPYKSPLTPKGVPMDVGLCTPKVCSSEDVTVFIRSVLQGVNSSVTVQDTTNCHRKENETFSTAATIMIVVCGVFGLLLVLGSGLDLLWDQEREASPLKVVNAMDDGESGSHYEQNVEEDERPLEPNALAPNIAPRLWEKALLSFSVFTNGRKILDASQQPGRLNCLDGVRFLSMSWVILGHTYAFAEAYVNNILPFLNSVTKSWAYQVIVQGTFSVDSFFVLSGLLTAYFFLKEANKLGTLRSKRFWILYFVHRYWRLTPPYMLFLGFHTALMRYWSNGPMWGQGMLKIEEDVCKKYWWTNLLYINNLIDSKKMCMGWSWYLANDMQFHFFVATIILPLFFFALRYPHRIYIFLAAVVSLSFVLLSMLSTGLILKLKNINSTDPNYFTDIYEAPWCRVGAYVVGLVLGCLILEQQRRKWRLHPALVVSGWVLAAGLCLSVIYGNSGVSAGNYQNSPDVTNLYTSTSRVAWALGLSWVLFTCCAGYGGPVNRLLSWPAFIPLSRLTYFAYIVHPVVIFVFYSSLRQVLTVSTQMMVWLFMGNLVISYLFAFVFSLAWESPMIGLERVVLGK